MANDFLSFKLPDDFVDSYREKEVPWGFPIGAGNSLGELTFITKYSRRKEDGSKETWVDTGRRVIEGMFSIQKDWCKENRLPWNENKAQATAKDAFDRLFVGKWTPPGRGLWMMGTEFVHAKKNSAALQNCSFLSTEHISTRSVHDATWPFVRLMEMSMLGVGVGFDTKGADKLTIHQPLEEVEVLVVEDSREGWCESVGKLLESYFFAGRPTFDFDYSLVRPSGEPINGFGGTAAGPGPLIDLHNSLKAQFNGREGEKLSSTDIVDIQNKIGKCITGDTWVLTVDGPRQVRDLVGVKTDLIVNGRTYKMISDGFWKTGEKEVFDLKTDRGYSLSLTAEHQVLTESGWKKAEDISIGEKIVLHNHENFSWSGTGTQEDGYLLGLLVGDGSIRKVNWGSGELALLFTWDQDKGSEFTKKAVESAMEGRKRRSDAIGWQKNGGEGRWMFQSSSITELARSYGIVRGNKTITPYVEEASSEFYVGFLRGLFDADASVNPETRTITLHQSNLELIQAAQRMLARLGIVSNINGPYRGKEYNLYIPAQHSDVFMERVGFANTRKSDTFYSKPRIYAAREKDFTAEVVEFTYVGTEEVFDVSVEEVHAFDANGVYVHNCVVAGNVRRSAEIALGAADDKDFLDLKNWEVNPDRMGANGWGHTSNNSIIAEVGGNYDSLAERIGENGEPGLLYLDLCRKYGRLIDPPNNKDYRVAGTNPCAEQSLESGECCVVANTLIHTDMGIVRIGDVVGQDISIWNGETWSKVTPFSTGILPVYRVYLSDGSYLDATPGHEWLVRKRGSKKFSEVTTKELEVGMYLPEFELPPMNDGKNLQNAYELGWFIGDGYVERGSAKIIVQENEYHVLDSMGTSHVYPEQFHSSGKGFVRALVDSIEQDLAISLRNHDIGLPELILSMDSESIKQFVAGWIDTDGSVIRQENTDHFLIYGSEQKLRDLQVLLRRIGVNHSTLRLFAESGTETNLGVRNYSLWRLLIPSYECANIPTRVKIATKFGIRTGVNNAHPASQIDRARKQKVVKVEVISEGEETFCFNEPALHRGVFGNVLTKQCTLVETFPVKHDSLEDYKRTIKVAYLYAKSVTLLPTHWPETNSIMQRNRRIGCSISGVAQFAERHGWAEMKTWLNQGYEEVQRYDVVYSDWLGVRESIKTTSVKPSGTVSLLFGVTPGVHWPTADVYIRRMRLASNDPLLKALEKAGYHTEPDVMDPVHSIVVELPTRGPQVRTEREVTMWEKAALAVLAQRYWADNQVSVTITFQPQEKDQISALLRSVDGQLKSISMLPLLEAGGAYAQMPYERISEEVWEQSTKKVKAIKWDALYAGQALDAEGEKFCTTDRCELPF